MSFEELDGNERRHLINVQQTYAAWLRARLEKSHHGGMHWKSAASGRDYLYLTKSKSQKSLGPRSAELETIYEKHQQRAQELAERLATLDDELARYAPVNKAYRLARVPTMTARILRRLKDTPRIDNSLIVVGTNALFAYEAKTGLRFSDALTATEDLDLLWDARKQLTLVLPDEEGVGIFALLKSVDRSFERVRPFRVENKQGFLVDIIRPELKSEATQATPRLSADADELEPSPIEGLQWLLDVPRFTEIAVAEDGLPVPITTVDPRAYALHKLWLSRKSRRAAIKKSRDLAQAHAVAEIAVKWLALPFDDQALSALPDELMSGVAELQKPHA